VVIYKIKLAAAGKGIVEQNREFCDWYARLNAGDDPAGAAAVRPAVGQPGHCPARATARQIELTLVSKKGDSAHQTVIRSEHQLVQPLSRADLERLATAQQNMQAFKLVSFEEYRKRD